MSKCEEKNRYREEKRAAKKLHREEKRQEKQRHREEKRELKRRHREEKRKHREDFVSKLFNLSLDDSSSSSTSNNNNPNIQISPERIENEVATLRTIFPDCDPLFIRSCLANESGSDDHIRKVAEYILTTDYPKVAPVSPLTPPTAPPLARNSFDSHHDSDAPPSYEESMGNQPLKPPPLPTRHQRAVSWNGNSNTTVISSRSNQLKPCQIPQQISQQISQQITRSAVSATTELNDAIGSVVKTLLTSMKPSTVDRAYHKYSHIWSRPVPSHIIPKPLTQQYKILPKDKFSIQKGFNQSNYPSRELKYHDISEEDWYCFMNGLNSLIGVNSTKGNPSDFGEGNSISLKWVSWMNVTMDESLMESNIKALNEYIDRWNSTYFNPRKIMVQFVHSKSQSNNPFKKNPFEQYILVKSI